MRKQTALLTMALVLCLLPLSYVTAGTFPEKPLTIVCWSSAGSGHDLMARMIAKVGEKYLGQPMGALNKTGGKGKIAMAYVMDKPADGYTIMTNTRSMTEDLTDPNGDITIDNFNYISRVVIDPFLVLVNKDSQFNTMDDLVAYAKANPQKVKMGGYSVQSVDQKLVNKIMKQTGTEFTYVPYKGGMEPVVAVLGGHVDVAVANPSEMLANYETGNVKVLATCSNKRFAPFDDVPTLKEQGIDVVEEHWRGVMASKDVPMEIIQTLDQAIKKTIDDPEFQAFLKSSSMYEGYLSSEEFSALVKQQTEENMAK